MTEPTMMPNRTQRILLVVCGILIVAAALVIVLRNSGGPVMDAVSLSQRQDQSDTIPETAVPVLLLSGPSGRSAFTILLKHTELPNTQYAVSLLIPPAGHESIPGLHPSSKSRGTAPDTLRVSIPDSLFTTTNGRYLLIINEFLLDDARGRQPQIMFYPFRVSR
ncbi:MAG TPA: hypothetical protein VMW43_05105 [Bacteroidota bacterium]|nr:hypothetical protein [Bacteroidota bacterium]